MQNLLILRRSQETFDSKIFSAYSFPHILIKGRYTMSVFSYPGIISLPRPSKLRAYITSHLRSPDIGSDAVREVLSEYGLNSTGVIQNMPNARRNRNLIVGTQEGPKVLKLYRADWRAETIAYEHSILAYLAGMGFRAPRLCATPAGSTRVSINERSYCVFECESGSNYSSMFLFRPHRKRLMRTAGRTLARLHRQLQGFLPVGRHHLGFSSYEGDRTRDLTWHVKRVSEFKQRSRQLGDPSAQLHADWLVSHAWQILDDLTDLKHAMKDADLPRTIIHGDFGLHNLIFQDADTATPMDFELARLEWRLSDLVSCLSKLRTRRGEYDLQSIHELLAAYQDEYPVSDEEWRWFPLVWRYYKLVKAVQYWSSYFETNGPVRKLALARDAVNQAVWLVNDPLTVAGLRSGMKREL